MKKRYYDEVEAEVKEISGMAGRGMHFQLAPHTPSPTSAEP